MGRCSYLHAIVMLGRLFILPVLFDILKYSLIWLFIYWTWTWLDYLYHSFLLFGKKLRSKNYLLNE